MQKDEIKVGDIVKVVKLGSSLNIPLIDTLLIITKKFNHGSFIATDSKDETWHVVIDINDFTDCGILVEKVNLTYEETKEYVLKLIEKVESKTKRTRKKNGKKIGEKVEHTYIDETDESKKYVDKLLSSDEVEKVETEKPFRMKTTAHRLYFRGQWVNITSDDEIQWETL